MSAATAPTPRLDGMSTDYPAFAPFLPAPITSTTGHQSPEAQKTNRTIAEKARDFFQTWAKHFKEFFKDNPKNCFKFVAQVCNWIYYGSANTNTVAKGVAVNASLGKGFCDLYSIPEKLSKLGEEISKRWMEVKKATENVAQKAALAVAHVFAKIGELAIACIDGVITLFSSMNVIKLTARASVLVSKISMCLLSYASLYNLCVNGDKIRTYRAEMKAGRDIDTNRKLITSRVIDCAMWVSYLALATIVLVSIYASISFAPWVPMICTTSALACTFFKWFYDYKHDLKDKEKKA